MSSSTSLLYLSRQLSSINTFQTSISRAIRLCGLCIYNCRKIVCRDRNSSVSVSRISGRLSYRIHVPQSDAPSGFRFSHALVTPLISAVRLSSRKSPPYLSKQVGVSIHDVRTVFFLILGKYIAQCHRLIITSNHD